MRRLLLSLLFLPSLALAQMTHVRVAQGALEGVGEGKVARFLGVPFAAPPVGDLRWAAPKAAPAWTGVRKADQFAASCMQGVTPQGFGPWTHEYVIQGPVSEDCLYANVWTPAKRASARLPVMVWIYGGGFNSGGGSVAVYDGRALAAKGIIVVNFNYRVGVYGFLAHPDLTKEAGASGNYGLMDQVAALRWVHDNIAAFGGDPDNVTIVGQSAGAASVHDLMASPETEGLFIRAVAQSGSGMGVDPPPLADGEAQGLAFQQAAGAADIKALRAMDTAAVDAAAKGQQFRPVIDGRVLTGLKERDVPLLTGMTANEAAAFGPPVSDVAAFTADIARTYGPLAGEVEALYPAGDAAEAETSRQALSRDKGLAAMDFWVEAQGKTAPVYGYLFSHVLPGPDAARYRAFHSAELPYVFGSFTPDRPFTAADHALGDEVEGYWVNFVKSGDPNGPGLPMWPKFEATGKEILNIDNDTHARPVLDAGKLDLFRRHQANGGKVSLF